MTYMTRQQQAVLDCIAACPGGCATAMALADRLRSGGQSVGLTTVYRQLERLEKQGLVHKLVTDEGACWQYCDCHAHIQHMDCGHLGELYQHVLQRHHFRINPRRTLFYGLCDRCSGEEPS